MIHSHTHLHFSSCLLAHSYHPYGLCGRVVREQIHWAMNIFTHLYSSIN